MKEKLDHKCFAHDRLVQYEENEKRGVSNEFDLEDIKGAAATITIAGNDTVIPVFSKHRSTTPNHVPWLTHHLDSCNRHAQCSVPDAEPRQAT